MKLVALACSQGLAYLDDSSLMQYYFPDQINDPDPQMFLFMKKKRLYGFFSCMGLDCLKTNEN